MDVTAQSISLVAARRLAVEGALLAGPKLPADGHGILSVIRRLGGLQIDPTRTVEKTHLLVLWSRLGSYDREELDVLIADGRLFEHAAFILPIERLPEIRFQMARFASGSGGWQTRVREWLAANRALRTSILDQLRADGPLPSRDVDGSALAVAWRSSGWTHGRSVSEMLEFMSQVGDVAVAGRQGNQRLWDLSERVLPAATEELSTDDYARRRAVAVVRRFGVATTKQIGQRVWYVSTTDVRRIVNELAEDGALRPVEVDLGSGDRTAGWAQADSLAAPRVAGRTTLLSPFDPLITDRDWTEKLFGFRYRLEMYVPKAQRKFGHFVLPILHRDRLIGRLDSSMDRRQSILRVHGLHAEEGAPRSAATGRAVGRAIGELAAFVGATDVAYEGTLPDGWRAALAR